MPEAITSCFIRPYYERDHLCHWEVMLNPVHVSTAQQIRSGHIQCDEISMFDDEHDAREFVRRLKANNPEMVELAAVPSRCPQETNLETQQ